LGYGFAIPMVGKSGRGVPFTLSRIYNTNVWANMSNAFQPVGTQGSGGGTTIAPYFGWLTQSPAGSIAFNGVNQSCQYFNGYTITTINYSILTDFRFYDSGGTAHTFGISLTPSGLPCATAHTTDSGSSQDGQGYFINADLSNLNNVSVTGRDGTVYHNSGNVVEDSNGNYISVATSTNETDYTDTTGQVVAKAIKSTTCTNPVDGLVYPNCVQYQLLQPGNNGLYVSYWEYDQNITVATASNCAGIADYPATTVSVPYAMTLPQYTAGNNWYYTFRYDGAGRLNSVRFPTGGVTTLSYGSLCTFGDGGPDSLSVTQNDQNGNIATTSYTRSSGQTVATFPDGAKQVVNFDTTTGLPTDVQMRDTDGLTVREEVAYTNSGLYPATAVTKLDGVNVSERDTTFDGFGDLTQETVKDLARDGTGATKRVTTISYLTGTAYSNANIYDRPAQVTVTDGTNTLAQTVIGYDNYSSPYTMTATSGLANHDSAYSTSNTTRGNPTSIARYVNGSTALTTYLGYEDTGNVLAIKEPNGNVISAVYGNCNNAYPSSVTVPGGNQTLTVECQMGLPTQVKDPNLAAVGISYDTYGRLISTSNPDGGGISSVSYDDPNNTKTTVKVDASQNLVQYQVSDGFGRGIYAQTQSPGVGWDTVETVYDSRGRVMKVSNPYNTTHAPAAGTQFTQTSYDGLNRPLTVTAVDGSVSRYSYNQNATQVTDPKGVARVLQVDGFSNLWKVCEVSGQSGSAACSLAIAASGYLTAYTYDMAGRLTLVAQGAQTRSWSFDWLGRTTSATDPETGTTNYTFDSVTNGLCSGGASTSTGALVFMSDAANMTTCFNYDTWHRLTQKAFSSGQTYTYAYDAASGNGLGRMTSATAPTVSLSYAYDSMGRPTTVSEAPAGLGSFNTTYQYNYLSAVTVLGAPSSRAVNYSYDAKGRLMTAVDSAGTPTYLADRQFNAADQIVSQHIGAAQPNPIPLSFTGVYNNMLQPFTMTYKGSTSGNLILQYQWGATIDVNGNVTSNDNNGTLRQVSDNAYTPITYTYDDLNRVATAAGGVTAQEAFDRYGNRTGQTGNLTQTTPADAGNHLTGFGYDAAGRLTSGSWSGVNSRSFTWDPEGKLLSYADANTATTTYAFDPFGRRSRTTPASGPVTYYFYGAEDGGHPVARYDTTNGWQTAILVEGTTLAYMSAGGSPTYLSLDMLTTTKMTTNSGGSSTTMGLYYPYGEESVSTGAERKWTNQIRDGNGIDHFWMRSYAAPLARWLTPDPAGAAAVDIANPQSWNRYAYVLNNPLNLRDPLGLDYCKWKNGTTSAHIDQKHCAGEGGEIVHVFDPRNLPICLGSGCPGPPADSSGGNWSGGGGGGVGGQPPAPKNSQTLPQCPSPSAPGSVVYKSGVPPASPQIYNFMLCVSACAGSPFRATSTSDSHPPNDPHSRGQAVDGTIPGVPGQVMQCGRNCGAMYEQNEYLNPSANATAGHYHFQLVPGRGGATGPGTQTCHY